MQHTTNYNLPQWEDTDAVRRENVNGAMSAVDTALKSAADAAAEAGRIVKLSSYTLAEAADHFDASIAGIDISSYAAVLIVCCPPGPRSGLQFRFRIDNAENGYLGTSDSDTAIGSPYLLNAEMPVMFSARCVPGESVTAFASYWHNKTNYRMNTTITRILKAGDQFSTFNVLPYTEGSFLPAGVTVTLYGIRY